VTRIEVELSCMLYGGSPRQILHCSADVSHDEKESMLQWTDELRGSAEFADFLADGGKCWIDMPLSTGRRLLLRAFSSREAGRGLWFFWGLFLSSGDFAVVRNYEGLLEFVESQTVENIRSWQFPSAGARLIVPLRDPGCTRPGDSPPLFSREQAAEWLTADWVVRRTRYRHEIVGPQLFIAFNPPKTHPQFTALLLSQDFPYPGLRLDEPTDGDDTRGEVTQKKKQPRNLRVRAAVLIGTLLLVGTILAAAFHGSATNSHGFSLLLVDQGDSPTPAPILRIPRRPDNRLWVLIQNSATDGIEIRAEATSDALHLGSGHCVEQGKYLIPVNLAASSDPNDPVPLEILVSCQRYRVAAEVIRVPAVLESADISLQEELSLQLSGDDHAAARSLTLAGVAAARYGIAEVRIDGSRATLTKTANGKAGYWQAAWGDSRGLGRGSVQVEVTDLFGNSASFERSLPTSPTWPRDGGRP